MWFFFRGNMSLKKTNDLGTISIANSVIAQIIFDGMEQEGCRNRIWPSTPRGRQIGKVARFMDTEFSMYLDPQYDQDERIHLEFSVLCRFGISIRQTTKVLADYIAETIKSYSGRYPAEIIINIAAVKTRNKKARRNTRVVYRYEAD